MSKKIISIYDTTLRDGAQTVGISLSIQDKLNIAKILNWLKVDFIEGGWPGSNPKDDSFFSEVRKLDINHSKIAAFGSTRRKGFKCSEDTILQSLVNSKADVLTIVAKTWDFQVDGNKANSDYSLQCIEKACEAGADMIVLCDTNGGTLPSEAYKITSSVTSKIKTPVGGHFHNDTGVAVANSMYAVDGGAVSIQGTINGYGERCGNCDLTTFIPNLVLKMGHDCSSKSELQHLTEVSRFVSEIANLPHVENSPYVGDNAFAHKGGIHVSALQKDSRTYEHIDPALTGNRRKVMISELSGKSNVEFKAKELGIDIEGDINLSKKVLEKIKNLEEKGFQFEAAEGSFELIIREATGEYTPFFKFLGFRMITEMDESNKLLCEATIKVEVGGQLEHTAANGNGPVDAIDNALRKALTKFYPEIAQMHLADYKVRVLDDNNGTASSVRVLIDQTDGVDHWGTVGVSTNMIEASWMALVDGIEFMLYKKRKNTVKN
ncbi:MAG: citramalate synthase [Spirochaetae bacterium HGW-Spirochaetae-5]|nr:MAG: citramalate synthase [Spirochaetae bacterium HGW-Spirochaetae-5]